MSNDLGLTDAHKYTNFLTYTLRNSHCHYCNESTICYFRIRVLPRFIYKGITSQLATCSSSLELYRSHTAASALGVLMAMCDVGARCSSFFISRVLLIWSRRSLLSSTMKCVLNKRATKPTSAPVEPSTKLHFGS